MIQTRQEVTGGKPSAYFVVSRAIKNTKLSGEVAAVLKDYGLPVFSHGTTQRVAYPTSASEGRTVLDKPDVAEEIRGIKEELKGVIHANS